MWGPSRAGNPVRVLPAPPRPGLGLGDRGAGWVAPSSGPGAQVCFFQRLAVTHFAGTYPPG